MSHSIPIEDHHGMLALTPKKGAKALLGMLIYLREIWAPSASVD